MSRKPKGIKRKRLAKVRLEQVCHGKQLTIAPSISDLVTTGTHITPDGMRLELKVIARPIAEHLPARGYVVGQQRDVYLCEVVPPDYAVRSAILWHTNCPLPTVKRLVLWCEILRIPVVCEPVGCLEPQWKWPETSNPASAKPEKVKASSFLKFD